MDTILTQATLLGASIAGLWLPNESMTTTRILNILANKNWSEFVSRQNGQAVQSDFGSNGLSIKNVKVVRSNDKVAIVTHFEDAIDFSRLMPWYIREAFNAGQNQFLQYPVDAKTTCEVYKPHSRDVYRQMACVTKLDFDEFVRRMEKN